MLKITVLTICPEYFDSFRNSHVAERAEKLGLAQIEIVDIRSYAGGSFRHVDDSPYGGGRGMILRLPPLLAAMEATGAAEGHKILLSPAGSLFDQSTAHRLAGKDHIILICGHYEGVDARIERYLDEEISLGDFILSGGDPAAITVMDAILRLLPGNLKEGSAEDESFENGLLEYPQYTKPAIVAGDPVPEILRSGNHAAVENWRQQEREKRTRERRPDLWEKWIKNHQ